MKKRSFRSISIKLTLILVLVPLMFFGQENKYSFLSHWYISANGGVSYSHGDVTKYFDFPEWPDFKNISPGGGLKFGRQFTPIFGLNLALYRGFLKGANNYGASFESDLYDYSLNGTVNFNQLSGIFQDSKFNLSAHVGIGQVHYKAKIIDENGTNWYGYDNSPEEFRGSGIKGRLIELIIPFGVEMDYKISDKLFINADFTLKIVNSDLLDGRAAGAKNDWYNFSSLGLRYNIGKTKKEIPQPKIEKPVQEVVEPVKVVDQPKEEQVVVERYVEPKPVYVTPKPIETKPSKEYRVQIRASFRQSLKISDLSTKYRLNQSDIVFGGVYKNYYIYTFGSYNTYEEAKRRCDSLKSNNGIFDAFIVRFENGKRVWP